MARLTVRDMIQKLSEVPEDLRDREFVVSATNTGFRTVFPDTTTGFNTAIVGREFVVQLNGTQDPHQLLR